MDKRTYIRTDEGEGETHFTCQDITCHMSVQCNAIQPSSIVQFSTAVGWFTKNTKSYFKKKIKLWRVEILQQELEVKKKLLRKKYVILCVHFDQSTEILVFEEFIKKGQKKL